MVLINNHNSKDNFKFMSMNRINIPTSRDMVSILGEDFFKEEVRCDYLVTEKMKKVWAARFMLWEEMQSGQPEDLPGGREKNFFSSFLMM